MPSGRERDLIREGRELGNDVRNERQKNVLLCEAARLAREEVNTAIQKNKQIVEVSKKLCQKCKAPGVSKKLCQKCKAPGARSPRRRNG